LSIRNDRIPFVHRRYLVKAMKAARH